MTRTFSGTPTNSDLATLSIKVTATDDHNASISDTFQISVTSGNGPPTITSGGGADSDSVSVAENGLLATTVDASDPDGDALTYSIKGGSDAHLFAIDAVTGALSFIAAPDYETPGDADGDRIYHVTIEVSDGTASDTQSLAITVANVVGATINGTNAGESRTGTNEEETILGLGGADTLSGLGGNDTIEGGAGNDSLIGGAGADRMLGGHGNDIFVVDSLLDTIVENAHGPDGAWFLLTGGSCKRRTADVHGLRSIRRHRQRAREHHPGWERQRHTR